MQLLSHIREGTWGQITTSASTSYTQTAVHIGFLRHLETQVSRTRCDFVTQTSKSQGTHSPSYASGFGNEAKLQDAGIENSATVRKEQGNE